MELILKEFKGLEIVFDSNGWINATNTCKKHNKQLDNFIRSKFFIEYCNSVEKLRYVKITELKKVVLGKGKEQGTYLHPYLLILFARYISSDFAVFCDILNENQFKDQIQLKQSIINKSQEVINELIEDRDKSRWWMND